MVWITNMKEGMKMKRSMLLAGSLVLGLLMGLGCSGDDGGLGQAGPAGADGSPQPIKILIAGGDPAQLTTVMSGMTKDGGLVIGTIVNGVVITDSVPPVSVLSGYDAILIYTGVPPIYPDSLGDALADYVDAGGGVVVGVPANLTSSGYEVTGRFATPGYSPWVHTASTGNATSPRTIDFSSLSQPLHKIFNGTDPLNMTLATTPTDPNPGVEATATLIALDSEGINCIAVNASGRVIGLNYYPPFQPGVHVDAVRLMGNALRCVAGNF